MSPLQPVDGLLAVVQRHDEDIQGHHVLTLDEAIERFEDTNLIGDLKHCKTVLGRRAKEDRFQTSDHLVIINPVATPTLHMEVVMAMLTACLKFERQHGAVHGPWTSRSRSLHCAVPSRFSPSSSKPQPPTS